MVWSYDGGAPSTHLGARLGAAGDVDGDGLSDFTSGNPWDGGGSVFGILGSADWSDLKLDWFWYGGGDSGHGLASGDFDGDGYDDLAIGSPASGAGQVDFFSGNRGEWSAPSPWPFQARQTHPDGWPLAVGGVSDADDGFLVKILGRTPLGAGIVTAEVEVRELGIPFAGSPTRSLACEPGRLIGGSIGPPQV